MCHRPHMATRNERTCHPQAVNYTLKARNSKANWLLPIRSLHSRILGSAIFHDVSSIFQLACLHILVPRGAPQPYPGPQQHISNTTISPLVFPRPLQRVSFIYCFGLADNSIGQWSTRVGSHVPHVESFPLGLTSRYVPPR
jgi:hypothetical protein